MRIRLQVYKELCRGNMKFIFETPAYLDGIMIFILYSIVCTANQILRWQLYLVYILNIMTKHYLVCIFYEITNGRVQIFFYHIFCYQRIFTFCRQYRKFNLPWFYDELKTSLEVLLLHNTFHNHLYDSFRKQTINKNLSLTRFLITQYFVVRQLKNMCKI